MEFNFFYNNLILVPTISFLWAVLFKWISTYIVDWKVDINKALWSWWMPSVHSAVVVSITMAIAIKYWVFHDLFALALSFTTIILYDAINVRFEAWQHAAAINKLLWERFKEKLWHLPSEAFAGSVLWIVVAIILYYI